MILEIAERICVHYTDSNGIKSAFHTEISLFKAAINETHRCAGRDADFRSKRLFKTPNGASAPVVGGLWDLNTPLSPPSHQRQASD